MKPTRSATPIESYERERAEKFGQAHVFDHWDQLDEQGRERLVGDLSGVDYELMARLSAMVASGDQVAEAPELTPPELFPLQRDSELEARAEAAAELGAEHLAAGKVGFMIVAGGQGSRLGYDGPKGCFELGPLTDRSLFAYHAARLRAAGARHGFEPVWYVMTSPINAAATRAFFETREHFGLRPENVFFFSQAMLPALDLEGRLLLASPGELFLAPNGHGGSLSALAESGALEDMRTRGIETISYFQVDNPLARPGDPLFLGLHRHARAGMSSKVVSKRDAHEKVGVIGGVNGRLGCIEYSDLSAELRDARDAEGNLVFRAGNIALHSLEVDFVRGLTQGGKLKLPWHIARKRMSVLGKDGVRVEVDGVKFESFVFDALAETQSSVTLEVARQHEFSPVKNKEGADSADSCRADLGRVFREIASSRGVTVPEAGLEIDPLYAESPEEFARRSESPVEVAGGHVFESSESRR